MNFDPRRPGAHARADFPALGEDAAQPQQLSLDLGEIFQIVRRRLPLIVACVVLSVAAAGLLLSTMTPKYTATAQIMLESPSNVDRSIEDLVVGLSADTTAIEGELALMLSRRLLARVGERLGLIGDPEFNPQLREPAPVNQMIGGAKRFVKRLVLGDGGGAAGAASPAAGAGAGGDEQALLALDAAAGAEQEVLGEYAGVANALRSSVRATQPGRSQLVDLRVTSADPRKAAAIANTSVNMYIEDRLEAKFESSRRLANWLTGRIRMLKANLETSEASVERFQEKLKGPDGEEPERLTRQIAELTSKLTAAMANHAQLNAQHVKARTLADGAGALVAMEVLSSDVLDSYRTTLARLQRREAEVAERFGESHPRLASIRLEIASVSDEMRREIDRLIEELRNDVAVAEAEVAALETSLGELEEKSRRLGADSVQLRQLERDAEANLVIYENFLAKLKRASEVEELQQADARVISYATPPSSPSSPKVGTTLALALVAGGFAGVGLAFLIEFFNRTFSTPEQVSRETGLPVFASISKLRRGLRRARPLDWARTKPRSIIADEARRLRSFLSLDEVGTTRAVAVTSSLSGEGKTTTSLLLAWACAQAGRSCVVIRADAPPKGAPGAQGGEGPDLVAAIRGEASLEEALRRDDHGGFDVLPALRAVDDPSALFSSGRARSIVEMLRERYDVVIFDTPASFLRSDASVLSRYADTILFAVQWRRTGRETVLQCLTAITAMHPGKSLGLVLTMVDRSREHLYQHTGYKRSLSDYRRSRA